MIKRVLTVGLALLFVSAALAQTTPKKTRTVAAPRTTNTLRLLNERVPEVTFESVPFEQVMEWVADFTGMNVVVRWDILDGAGVARDKPITVKVKNLRLSQVLWMIMNEAGGADTKLAYRSSGTLLILSTVEDLNKEMITKVYDVADLLTRATRFNNAARMDPSQALSQGGQAGGGGGGGGTQLFQSNQQGGETADQQQGQESDIQTLITLITSTVEPDSWNTGGGAGQVYAYRNLLVVYNTLLVHQKIGGYVQEGAVGP